MPAIKSAIATAIALLLLQQGFVEAMADDSCLPESGLARYIGSYDNEGLIHDPRIEIVLREQLGEAWPHFLSNLDVRGAVDLISGELSLAGNAAHGGGSEEAVLCISLRDDRVSAAIFSQGEITIYSARPEYVAQGLCIKDWITLVNSGHHDRLQQPGNVRVANSGDSLLN